MKKFLTALVASASLLVAIPASASAHEGDRDQGRAWQDRDGARNGFNQEFQHIYGGVQHGVQDGSFSRREARQFYWAINSLRGRLDAYWNNDGYLSRAERYDIQRRIERLHADMHDAHDSDHAERDYGYRDGRGDYGQGYGQDGYRNDGGDNGYDGYRRR